jgi:cell division septum initiation protein DivIVA
MSDTVTTGTGSGSTGSTPSGAQEKASEVAGAAKDQATEVASTAKEQAASVASTATEQAANVASAAGEQARAVASDAKQQARQIVDNGRQQLRSQAGEQTQRAASSLRDLGDQLQKMASGQGGAEGPAVDLARQAADGVQRFADSLENRRPEDLLEDVKRFARQRPGVFVLGALGAGFLAGRVLRTIDTSAITDAAKSGAGIGQSDGGQELVSGPGTLGALQAGGPSDLGTGDALAAGMAGTTPADLVDPPTTAIPTVPTSLSPETPITGSEV